MTREEAEQRFQQAAKARREANREYQRAIKTCAEAGVSNIKMGSLAGVSETAIRMYRKRHNL